MSDELPFKLTISLLGKYFVTYECPQCKRTLENSLNDAGNKDSCPACGNSFIVPGKSAIEELERERIQKEEDAKENAARKAQKAHNRKLKEEKAREHALRMAQSLEEEKRRKAEQLQEEIKRSHTGYVYHVEEFLPRWPGCAKDLTDRINQFSQHGWEYVDFNIVSTYSAPGCIGSLLGLPGQVFVHHLVTFKKKIETQKNDPN